MIQLFIVNHERPYPYNSEFGTQPAENFAVLNGFETVHYAALEIGTARERVVAQFMASYIGHPQNLLFRALEESAKRGVGTSLTLDCYSKDISHDGMPHVLKIFPFGEGRKVRSLYKKVTNQRYEELKQTGVQLEFTNPTHGIRGKAFPFSGRNHFKLIVADNTSYLGGVQMDESSFEGLDFMVRIEDKELADALVATRKSKDEKDYSVHLSSGDTLHVDVGRKGESVILHRAIEVVDQAQVHILVASEFLPHGEFRQALYNAIQRGVAVSFLISDPDNEFILLKPFSAKFRFEGRYMPVPTHFVMGRNIHAKLLIADDTAIFGSHNFSPFTVENGTEEIALETTNPVLVKNLRDFFRKMHQK